MHQHYPGNTQELFLSLGNIPPVFRDHRIISLGQPGDKAVGMYPFRRLHNLFPGSIRSSVGDIFMNRSRFQPGLLQHHSKIGAERISCDMADGRSVNLQRTGIHIVKPHQQIDQRRLSASGRTDDGDPLARFHLQVQIFNQRNLRIIGKSYLIEFYPAFSFFQHHRVVIVGSYRRFIDKGKQSLGACQCVLQLRHNPGNFIEWFRILIRVGKER